MSKPRNTRRKALISEVLDTEYRGRPVLLEELRWEVFLREEADAAGHEMTISYAKSFCRTLREQLPDLATPLVFSPSQMPVGALAIAAANRAKSRAIRHLLLTDPTIRVHISVNTDVEETDDGPRRRNVDHVIIGCWFHQYKPHVEMAAVAWALFPLTSRILVVNPQGEHDINGVAMRCPWRVYRRNPRNSTLAGRRRLKLLEQV